MGRPFCIYSAEMAFVDGAAFFRLVDKMSQIYDEQSDFLEFTLASGGAPHHDAQRIIEVKRFTRLLGPINRIKEPPHADQTYCIITCAGRCFVSVQSGNNDIGSGNRKDDS
ncbi:MAG: hypothetical protein DHS20C05_05620 [Hyphococcus sp.]|nr:MAG: hypothetical protein DHS20C05_05620 [Marinicaulis sp.]